MRIGFKTSQTDVDWPTLLATWELGDELEVFDSAWIFDHFVSLATEDGDAHEAVVVASALAARTRRLQLGHLVLSNTYRHPAVLAKVGATLDHVASGRFVLGLGAGWHQREHDMYGIEMPAIGERISRLRAAVRVLRALWDTPDGATLETPYYRLRGAVCHPAPLTPGGPAIWLGGQGPRGLRIVAELADGWNHTGAFDEFGPKLEALERHCEELGRNRATVEVSAQVFLRNGDHPALLREASRFAAAGVQHLVLYMPAAGGPAGLRRLATEVAEPLRERFG